MAERVTRGPDLPVAFVLDSLAAALADAGRAVLQAPPGAGKTTLVPLGLLDAPWLAGARIVMLEPRRVAARAAAYRMAEMLGEPIGQTVGFRTRTESRVGARTRIEVVTEGILTRRLQRDPTLDGVGLVIFDEFHERSLVADLGLALTLHSRRLVRDDLRLLIMSATLDTGSVSRLLDGAPVITAEGRLFPVDTRYAPPRDPHAIEAAVASTVRRAIASHPGDVLVFLPGAAEISRVQSSLGALTDVDVLALHGSLASEDQDRAVRPAARRRVVLATSIAETSLTIPGIQVVVDSGLARRPRFSASTAMSRLETGRVSRATADQRRGRAGRTAAGVCYRLWHEYEELAPAPIPEILDADLASLALDLAALGIHDVSDLSWIDPPPQGSFRAARELLRALGFLNQEGQLTPTGQQASAMPVHPRIAHMLVRAAPAGRRAAAALAALLNERDVIRFDGPSRDADVRVRIDVIAAVRQRTGAFTPPGSTVLRDTADRVIREADRLESSLPEAGGDVDTDDPGILLALAYPDRVAMQRPGQRGRYVTRDGIDVTIDPGTLLANATFIVAAALDGKRPISRAYLAAPIERRAVESLFVNDIAVAREVAWSDESETVQASERRRLGSIILSENAVSADPTDVATALLDALLGRGLLDREEIRGELARLAFAYRIDPRPEFALEEDTLARTASEWLLPALIGRRTLADANRVDLGEALLSRFDFRSRQRFDEIAPSHVTVPTGTRARVDYSDPAAPSIAVRIQELFGLAETPRVGLGRVALTIQLLSPARRPVQVTRDLAGFWKGSYFDVRKELRGRYPKHPWPDDPAHATPTRRTKPR